MTDIQTPSDRWGFLVEFWDRKLQGAESEEDRQRFQIEASEAWTFLNFYERRPKAGFNLVDGKVRAR